MPSERKVTRTVMATKCTCLVVDLTTQTTAEEVVTIPRTYEDEAAALKYIAKHYDSDAKKYVHVSAMEVEEKLYGMSEEQFIKNAEVLPPRPPREKPPVDGNAVQQ